MFTIDLTKQQQLNENLARAWGAWNKFLLKYIYGKDTNIVANLNEEETSDLQFKISGNYEDVKAYAHAIKLEADYLRSYIDNGKDAPETVAIKKDLTVASANFVEKTGLPWPFRD